MKKSTKLYWLEGFLDQLPQRFIAVIGVIVVVIIATNTSGQQFSSLSPAMSLLLENKISYGVALGSTLSNLQKPDRAVLLAKIKGYGYDEVRFNVDWDLVQRTNSTTYDWTKTDEIIGQVRDSGLKMILILNRTPPWARSTQCSTSVYCYPKDIGLFSRFSVVSAKRYQSYGISAWEIWNEPNIVYFWPTNPNPNDYARMLIGAYKAIKPQVPSATILVGGLAGNAVDFNGSSAIDPRTFMTKLYAANAGSYFDGIAYHPYTGPRLPSVENGYNGWYKMDTGDYTLRSVMTQNGDSVKGVWLTEFGVPTGGSGAVVTDPGNPIKPEGADHVTPEAQAQITQAALDSLAGYSWVKSFDWYSHKDDYYAATNSGAAYGYLYYDGSPKPVFDMLQKVIQ